MRTNWTRHPGRIGCRLFGQRSIVVVISLVAILLCADPARAKELKVLPMGLGTGTITSTPSGINCGSNGNDCVQSFSDSQSVTLTANPDSGSTFAGWHVDPDTDPNTTPDCPGTSTSPCTLSMDKIRKVRPVFKLSSSISTLNRPTGSSGKKQAYPPSKIKSFLQNNPNVDSAARFLAALPEEFKQNWILMTRSESLQTGTARFPRVILPSADAKAVFTLGLAKHSSYPASHPDAIEYMQWDPKQNNFRFHEIVLSQIPPIDPDNDQIGRIPQRQRGVLDDEPRCTKCHSTQNVANSDPELGTTPGSVIAKMKPNWDTYDSWGGMLAFNRDRIYQGSVEAAAFRKLFNPWTWTGNDPVRTIMAQLRLQPSNVGSRDKITRLAGGKDDGRIQFAFGRTQTKPDTKTAYSFDGKAGSGTNKSSVKRDNMKFVTLNHTGSPGSDEGRAVELFDRLGGLDNDLNAQRIADELINHRFATSSAPIDVRPIALAITEGYLKIDSQKNKVVSTKSKSLNVNQSFFDDRHGMRINKLREDTRNRAQSIPRRKADIEARTLDRSVQNFTDSVVQYMIQKDKNENGLIQEYGSNTSQGTSTKKPRLRQEVFRRGIDKGNPDQTVMGGMYVDREEYSNSNPQKIDPINRTTLYRYFLEPLGVSVDKWSMGVRGRSRTYTFADVFSNYRSTIRKELTKSLKNDPPTPMNPNTFDPNDPNELIEAVNRTLSSLPPADQIPTYTDVQRIFNKSCIECHGGLDYPPYERYSSQNPNAVLNLSEQENPPSGWDRLDRSHGNASARVQSGKLYQRITGNYDLIRGGSFKKQKGTKPYKPTKINENCPNFTNLMPCGGPPLSQADIMTINRWIKGGHPNTRGDPHIETIDGVNYDFQAAGEFVMLHGRSLELQARQTAVETSTPLGPDSHTGLTCCVSVNTGVAVRSGPDRITYQARPGEERDPDDLQLRIDGELHELGRDGIALSSGSRVFPTSAPGGIQIETPDGQVVVITPGWWSHHNLWYMNIDTRGVRTTRGVMGSIPADSWLPRLPDGSSLGRRPKELDTRYEVLYEEFGEAWQVTEENSLFDYAPGNSPSSHSMERWPRGESPESCDLTAERPGGSADPPPQVLPVARAEELCSGIDDPEDRQNCIDDVRVMAESNFAETYLWSQRLDQNKAPDRPSLVSPVPGEEGVAIPVSFEWNRSSDAEGNAISYRHCFWAVGESPADKMCVNVADTTPLIGLAPGTTLILLIIVVLAVIAFVLYTLRNRPVTAVITALVVLCLGIVMYFTGVDRPMSTTEPRLKPGQRYYWQVIAEDENGKRTRSKIRYFETEKKSDP